MRQAWKLWIVALGLSVAGLALGQDSRALRLVVPYPAGGIVDLQARLIAPAMKRHAQRDVVVDNIAGAAGAIGLQHLLAAAGGTELVLGTDSDVVLAPLFNPELRYSTGQFELLAVLGSAPMALVARPGFEPAALRRLIADARPEAELRLASYGIGSNAHLVAHDFARRLRLSWLHVPYRGVAPLLQDVMAGTVDAAFLPLAAGIPDLVRAGKVHLLGLASSRRVADFPEAPTFEELGLGGFLHSSWSALLIPAAAEAGTATRLREAATATTLDAEVREKLAGLGLALVRVPSRAAAQAFLDAEVVRYQGLLAALPRAAGETAR